MTTTADRYGAYTDAELAQIWNSGSFAIVERDAIARELARRGYDRARVASGAAVHVPESRRVDDAPAADVPDHRYVVHLSHDVDDDGEYRAAILDAAGENTLRVMFDADRDHLRERVASWADAHRKPRTPDEVYEV